MKKSQLKKIIRESIKQLMNEQTSCDNSMAGSCAQQWLPPNYNWANQTNYACTGGSTFNYRTLLANMSNQIVQIFVQLNLSSLLTTIPPLNNYSDISNWVNSTGIPQPQKGQVKRKAAKSSWAKCMIAECNC